MNWLIHSLWNLRWSDGITDCNPCHSLCSQSAWLSPAAPPSASSPSPLFSGPPSHSHCRAHRVSSHSNKSLSVENKQTCPGGERWSQRRSPFWGAGRVSSGDAGLHAVWALQAQGVICLVATRWRLMMQDGVMDCGRQICERGGRGRCQRPTVSSVGSVTSVLHVPPTETSHCILSIFLCELMSACWVKPTDELSINILPLFCRDSCLLGSMSNGFDMSLSTSCNPCKENIK